MAATYPAFQDSEDFKAGFADESICPEGHGRLFMDRRGCRLCHFEHKLFCDGNAEDLSYDELVRMFERAETGEQHAALCRLSAELEKRS